MSDDRLQLKEHSCTVRSSTDIFYQFSKGRWEARGIQFFQNLVWCIHSMKVLTLSVIDTLIVFVTAFVSSFRTLGSSHVTLLTSWFLRLLHPLLLYFLISLSLGMPQKLLSTSLLCISIWYSLCLKN